MVTTNPTRAARRRYVPAHRKAPTGPSLRLGDVTRQLAVAAGPLGVAGVAAAGVVLAGAPLAAGPALHTAGAAPVATLAAFTSTTALPETHGGSVVRAAAVTGGATSYTVVPGDTLAAIAQRFGTTVAALAAANSLSDPNRIYAGQTLTLSATAAVTSPGAPPATSYTVVPGDTLAAIAQRFGTTVAALAAANSLSDPNRIYAGQTLTLSANAAAANPGAPPPPPAPPAPAGAATTFTVPAGDTLAAIAQHFGTTVAALAAANSLSDPNRIYAGETLTLATTAAGAPAAPAPSARAQVAVRTALAQVGKPYQWAGAGPDSFDCSGLVMYAWAAAGVQLVHYTVAQFNETTPLTEAQLQPGDLIFFRTASGPQPGHVAMYVGNGDVVAADYPGSDVRVEPLSSEGVILGFRRVG